jgi:hypothetical protein
MCGKFAEITAPIISTVTYIGVRNQVASASILARNKTAIRNQEIRNLPLTTSSNGTSRAIANHSSVYDIAKSVILTRIRRTSSWSLALGTKISSRTAASVGTVNSSAAGTIIPTRRTKSTIGLERQKVILEVGHQSSFAESPRIISRTNTVGPAVSSSSASTVVLARVVSSGANNRCGTVRTSPVGITSTLKTLSYNIVAGSTVQARGTTISKVFLQRVLAEDTIVVTRTLTHGTSTRNKTFSTILTRVYGTKSGNIAPLSGPASGTNTTEFSLNTVIITDTIVQASSSKSTVERKVSKRILTGITKV